MFGGSETLFVPSIGSETPGGGKPGFWDPPLDALAASGKLLGSAGAGVGDHAPRSVELYECVLDSDGLGI